MKGLILVNSYSNLNSQLKQVSRFTEEFEKLGVIIDVKKTSSIPAFIDSKNVNNMDSDYDFILYLDKDKYYARMLENLGYRLFNNSRAIEVCDDKMLTNIELARGHFPMPKTIPGVLCYTPGVELDNKIIETVEEELSYPLIVKECFGSLGKGVYLINNHQELIEIANKLKYVPHLFQEYIKESYGTDIRVCVIGGKAIAWMQRKSENDFRSNIEVGGKGIKIDLPEDFKKLAESVAKFLNLDYCGIDLLIGKDNKPYVCEVNSNAFFNELERVSKENVALAYCKHILDKI